MEEFNCNLSCFVNPCMVPSNLGGNWFCIAVTGLCIINAVTINDSDNDNDNNNFMAGVLEWRSEVVEAAWPSG